MRLGIDLFIDLACWDLNAKSYIPEDDAIEAIL
jgi:hypothetical protein